MDDRSPHQAAPRPLALAYQGTYQVQPLSFDSTTLPELSGKLMAAARGGVVSILRGAP
jgi:hypothetical protein